MKIKGIALLIAVVMIVNLNDFTYMTAYAASTEIQNDVANSTENLSNLESSNTITTQEGDYSQTNEPDLSDSKEYESVEEPVSQIESFSNQTGMDYDAESALIESISLNTEHEKLTYYVGVDDSLSFENILLTVHFKASAGKSDETLELAASDDFTVAFNSNDSGKIPVDIAPGTYPVEIGYRGVTASYEINILANQVKSIDIVKQPSKNNYYDFESDYDLSGLKFSINYSNGTTPVTLSYDDDSMSLNGYSVDFDWKNSTFSEEYEEDFPKTGSNAIVISYLNVKKEIPITVQSTPVKNLKIKSTPTKVYNTLWDFYSGFISDESIDLTGLELEITYLDNTIHTFKITDDDKTNGRIVDDDYKRKIKTWYSDNQIELTYMNQSVTYPIKTEDPNWSSATKLSLDTPVVSDIQNDDVGILYQFTPSKDETYKIYSYGEFGTYVKLFNSDKKLIDGNSEGGEEREEESEDFNFLLTTTLLSGNTYYFVVGASEVATFHTVISLESSSDIKTKTSINSIAVNNLSNPKVGENPDTIATIGENGECYIENISWIGMNNIDKFIAGTQYTASMTLKPQEGYQFTSTTTASVNGNNVISKKYNSDGSFTINYTFDYTNCIINIPTSDKYTITGDSSVAYGGEYTFSISYKNGYDYSNSKINANGILLTPNSNGIYTIPNVLEGQTIEVISTPNTTVAVIDISSDSTIDISSISNQIYTGSTLTPAIAIRRGAETLTLNTDYEVTFTNNASVGTASVAITGKGNYTGTITKTFTINAESISNCNVADISTQTYSGGAITPAILISRGGATLTLNNDYEATYTNNTNAGTASITITGKGNYTGTVTKTYNISAKNIESTSVESISDVWYSGSEQQPTPAIMDGNNTLSKEKDYSLSYSNNKNAGTANVTINGKGNYTGSKTVSFKIISTLDKVGNVTASSSKKSIELTWDKVSCANGYEIYRYNDSKKKYIKIGTSSQNSYINKKLSAGTTYKYKIRAYIKVNGKNVYGSYSSILKTGTCTTKPSIKVKLSKKNANISWKKVNGASGYEIYMSTSKDGTYSKIGTLTKSSKVSYTKKNLTKGNTYYFKVRTYSTINKVKIYSDYSSIKSVKVK